MLQDGNELYSAEWNGYQRTDCGHIASATKSVMAQAVSDLSAANAPSLMLWNQLSALYNACEVVCVTVVCIGIQGQKTRLLRSGIYLFAIMEWISAVGYRMFPLSSSGYAGAFQDVMHMVVTALVVLLSIVSLTVIIAADTERDNYMSAEEALAYGLIDKIIDKR